MTENNHAHLYFSTVLPGISTIMLFTPFYIICKSIGVSTKTPWGWGKRAQAVTGFKSCNEWHAVDSIG